MPKFEYRVFRCQVGWDGGDYYLEVKVQQEDEWTNANDLGALGWEFIGFWPDEVPYIKDSFNPEYVPLVKMAIFKRLAPDDRTVTDPEKVRLV